MLIGVISGLYYNWRKDDQTRLLHQYLQSTNADFESASLSLDELLATFQVAGEKVQIVDTLQESSASASGFFIALDDIEREIAKIETTRANIAQKKNDLVEKQSPALLIDLENRLEDFYSQSLSVLNELSEDHQFAKDLLLASGPKFYVPSLSQDDLWERANVEEILNYYKSTKEEANTTLTVLSKLTSNEKFKQYSQAQIDYMSVLVNLSDNIINTLSVADDKDAQAATQIEKSYQFLVGAKRENESLWQKLLTSKLQVFDIGQNLNKLAGVQISENSTRENFNITYNQVPKIDPINVYISNFLRGLQTPSLF